MTIVLGVMIFFGLILVLSIVAVFVCVAIDMLRGTVKWR